MMVKRKYAFALIIVAAVLLGTNSFNAAYALTLPNATYWQGPADLEADWFSSGNWDKGVPGSSDDAAIDNGGIAQITSGNAVAGSLYLAPGTTIYPSPGWDKKEGHLVQSGGNLTISNKLVLSATGGTSSYMLTNGNLSSLELNLYGNSLFQQTGGSASAGNLMVAGASSKYKLESGTLTITGEEKIDNSAIFEQTGGTHVADFLVFGSYPYGDKGHYALKGGTLSVNGSMELSNGSTFQHTGGLSNINVLFNDGDYSLSQANANTLSVLNTDSSFIGGSFSQSGGEHNAFEDQVVSGLYSLSGGINTVGDELEIQGWGNQAKYSMTGGSLTASEVTVGNTYGDGKLEVASGCTVLVKGGRNTLRTFENSSVDLMQGGKVFIGNVDTGLAGTVTIGIDGALEGTGTIMGDVSNQGIIRSGWPDWPYGYMGYAPGMLTIAGDYKQESDGILALFIAGTDMGTFSSIFIEGQAYLAGELNLALIGGFIPNIGDTFEILNAGSYYGSFSLIKSTGLPENMFFDIAYGSNAVVVEVVPEPSTLLLLGLGMIFIRRRTIQS